MTRVSDKNCLKYGLTAFLVGASGVPKLDKRIPILDWPADSCIDEHWYKGLPLIYFFQRDKIPYKIVNYFNLRFYPK